MPNYATTITPSREPMPWMLMLASAEGELIALVPLRIEKEEPHTLTFAGEARALRDSTLGLSLLIAADGQELEPRKVVAAKHPYVGKDFPMDVDSLTVKRGDVLKFEGVELHRHRPPGSFN